MPWQSQSQTNLPPRAGCVGREFRAFTPLTEGTEAEAQNQHKSKVKVSFPHRPQPQPWERLSEGSRSCCPQPPTTGGSGCEAPRLLLPSPHPCHAPRRQHGTH